MSGSLFLNVLKMSLSDSRKGSAEMSDLSRLYEALSAGRPASRPPADQKSPPDRPEKPARRRDEPVEELVSVRARDKAVHQVREPLDQILPPGSGPPGCPDLSRGTRSSGRNPARSRSTPPMP